jgi:hypothetical protein
MPDVKWQLITEDGGHRVLCNVDGREIETPPMEHLLFYAGLAALAGFGFIEWAVAAALGIGHVLIELTKRPGLEQLGEALAEA